MAYTIYSPANSFVQFGESNEVLSCGFQPMHPCLPVYYDDDVAFQFFVQGTEAEIDALCGPYGIIPLAGLTQDCETLDITFDEIPDTFRIDATHLLYQWTAGFPNFTSAYAVNDCFSFMVEIGGQTACTNCFYRAGGVCWTTELAYTNNDNYADFNYCSGGTSNAPVGDDCIEAFYTFSSESNMIIPYTADLVARYGVVPSVQVWIYDTNGELVDMGIRVALDTYPPTKLSFDFGGPASGVIRLSN